MLMVSQHPHPLFELDPDALEFKSLLNNEGGEYAFIHMMHETTYEGPAIPQNTFRDAKKTYPVSRSLSPRIGRPRFSGAQE